MRTHDSPVDCFVSDKNNSIFFKCPGHFVVVLVLFCFNPSALQGSHVGWMRRPSRRGPAFPTEDGVHWAARSARPHRTAAAQVSEAAGALPWRGRRVTQAPASGAARLPRSLSGPDTFPAGGGEW